MTTQLSTQTITFSLSSISESKLNLPAVAKVNQFLPELTEKTRAFDRNNSQHTLALMSLTMLNGQSPMRMIRQVMAEVEKRKMALAEAQVSHAKLLVEIQDLQKKDDPVSLAELRQKSFSLDMMESKVNGAFKDIATLIDAYINIKAKHGIDDWDEVAFESEEKRHHVRRGFELMYRNLLEGGRAQTATIEYLQQYGVHPQVALTEVSGYIQYVAEQIKAGALPHANDLEEFLDQMSAKYFANVDATSERLFGRSNFVNPDYMLKLESKNDS
jgi:hypothetical protein